MHYLLVLLYQTSLGEEGQLRTCSAETTCGFSSRTCIGTASSSAVAFRGLNVPDVSSMLCTPMLCSRCMTTPADKHQNDMHGMPATAPLSAAATWKWMRKHASICLCRSRAAARE
jgi:hypothetical protein